MMIYIIPLFIILIYFVFTKDDIDKNKIIDSYIKDINSLDSKNIIDESLIILLTIYKAELTRKSNKRWVHIHKFNYLDNTYKIIPKLIKLGYITNINKDEHGAPLLIINYDGV
jgi:hypothetical protein